MFDAAKTTYTSLTGTGTPASLFMSVGVATAAAGGGTEYSGDPATGVLHIPHIVSRSINLQHAAEQLNSEFLAHVLTLSALRHPNVVNLIGFCADGQYRILVHEHVPLGSLEDHLHPRDRSPAGKAPLDWNTRMNIAARVAKGLEYLHHKGVVYRKSMGSLDILLGDGYHPKMSQHGLADLGRLLAEDNKGWCTDFWGSTTIAPETYVTGKVTKESNVYSFGGLLLEMITGRRPIEPADEDRNLIAWATRLMKDRSQLRRMADPALQGRYPSMDLEEALTVASIGCLGSRGGKVCGRHKQDRQVSAELIHPALAVGMHAPMAEAWWQLGSLLVIGQEKHVVIRRPFKRICILDIKHTAIVM
ncbi:Serine/threonine-protein kinase PBS1 [Triticum urartu]|uniref:Serine/threonine-protein kinase PBS1 n=1 Tax=Triticum urartu TaxID=4572 RepID=M7ZLF6_TRIUA|nr:Serine/threonine-protein kinase PBS1 [Triticum urartu]